VNERRCRDAAVPLVLMVVLVSGCSGPTDGPRSTAQAYAADLARRDGAAVCRLLAPETRAEVAQSGKSPCRQAIVEEGLPDPGAVHGTQLWGRAAQVRMAGDTVFLSEFSSGWKVVAAGCTSQGSKPYDCLVQGG
jgi:hypothetical protein